MDHEFIAQCQRARRCLKRSREQRRKEGRDGTLLFAGLAHSHLCKGTCEGVIWEPAWQQTELKQLQPHQDQGV